MKTDRTWQGVRLRQTAAAPDPDAPARIVRLPAAWDDGAAAALCDLAPAGRPVSLPGLAQAWIRPVTAGARDAGCPDLPARLHALLLHRRAAPTADIWLGQPSDTPGFVLNLPAFLDPAAGFDSAAFTDAAVAAAQALTLIAPNAVRYAVSMSDLAGLLAALGLEYGSAEARAVASCLAAILRGRVDAVLAGPQRDLLAMVPGWPAPPAACAVPGLAEAAAAARQAAMRCGGMRQGTAILPPGPADALLGVETGGIAPAFAAVGSDGLLRATRSFLTARGVSLEHALAAALAGEAVAPTATASDHIAMHDAVAPFVQAMPPRPAAAPAAPVLREELPARRRGFTQKAAIGGHRVFLRTGEYADGRLGEIGIALPRDSAAVRALADAFAIAVSIGLQHGAPLASFVDALAHSRGGPSGPVEGDPAIDSASSIPDFVVRSLAAAYLGQVIPAAGIDPPAKTEDAPMLPLDLPLNRRRPALRLVAA